jgi:hypothetical protein
MLHIMINIKMRLFLDGIRIPFYMLLMLTHKTLHILKIDFLIFPSLSRKKNWHYFLWRETFSNLNMENFLLRHVLKWNNRKIFYGLFVETIPDEILLGSLRYNRKKGKLNRIIRWNLSLNFMAFSKQFICSSLCVSLDFWTYTFKSSLIRFCFPTKKVQFKWRKSDFKIDLF